VWRAQRVFPTGRSVAALLSERRDSGDDRVVSAEAGLALKPLETSSKGVGCSSLSSFTTAAKVRLIWDARKRSYVR
jgi:hypothetical protein